MELVEIKQELEKMTNRLADFRGSDRKSVV